MSILEDKFRDPTESAVSRLLCGELLGSGISRQVFVCEYNPKLVVKIEYTGTHHQNIHEMDLYCQLLEGGSKWVKWLAPCVKMSGNGRVLIQKRTKRVPSSFKLPAEVPPLFNDFKEENWGLLDGKLVCHDYGMHEAIYATCNKVRKWTKVDWIHSKDGHFKSYVRA